MSGAWRTAGCGASLEAIGPAAAPVLAKALAHPDSETRALAADALAGIGPPAVESLPALLEALKDQDVNQRCHRSHSTVEPI
jgi:HEAT repeat protein